MADNKIAQETTAPAKGHQYKIRLKNPADNPYQLLLCRSPLKRKIVRAGRRSGKSLPLNALVYTPSGPIKMGDVEIGQVVLTPFGTTARVEEIYPQGKLKIYRVEFGDGTSAECSGDHLWRIVESRTDSRWKRRHRIVTTMALAKMPTVTQNRHGETRRPRIPRTECVPYCAQPVPIDPYLLGVLIGDGGTTSGNIRFTCAEPEILERVRDICNPDIQVKHVDRYDYTLSRRGTTQLAMEHGQEGRHFHGEHRIIKALRDMGLLRKGSHEKFIPEIYKYNSQKVRLEIIRGILDTDGTVDDKGQPHLEQTSRRLAEDFREVIESLGGLCTWREKYGGYRMQNGDYKTTRLVYRQTVLYDDAGELFWLERKRKKTKPRARPAQRYVQRVEYVRTAEAQCIKISDPQGLFLTNHLIATHNTTVSAIMAVEAFLKGKRVLYAAPTIDQVDKFWSDVKKALDEPIRYKQLYKNETKHIIQPHPIQETDDDLNKNGDARIRAKTAYNAETLRGDWASLLILDEYQLMDETAWTEVGAPMLIDNNGDVLFIYTPPSLESKSASKARDPQHAAKMFKAHKDDPLWLCVHFPSSANPHLSREGLEEVSRNMTALAYRQEILAEDTEEIPGALWTRKIIEDSRVKAVPCDLRRIVVAIDPSGGNITEVGIVAAGEGVDGHLYVLRDVSMKAPRPKDWAETAIRLYYDLSADRIIGERNYGGDMIRATLENVDESVSYHDVNATRGKLIRAQPLLALFQQNKMHLVGQFPELEEEMVTYTAAAGQKSPNRLDAMCFVAGTMILTEQGEIPIEQIVPGIKVWTRTGWHRVLHAGGTGIRGVITKPFPNGRELTGTGDHPVFTANRGFIAMDTLNWCDIIATCTGKSLSSKGSDSFDIRLVPIGHVAITSWVQSMARMFYCIEQFGQRLMDRFRQSTTFTTLTKIHSITGSAILSVCQSKNTMNFIIADGAAGVSESTWLKFVFSRKLGIGAKTESIGTANMPKNRGKNENLRQEESASIAASHYGDSAARNSAIKRARDAIRIKLANTAKKLLAKFAATHSYSGNMLSVLKPAPLNAVESFAEVFNITVEDQPEYFANGILVHNCWAGIELTGIGSLGLIDLYKSGKAAEMVNKVSGASNMAAVMTNDQTPKCPSCESVCIQIVSGANRCGQCGFMWYEKGKEPQIQRPPRRMITLAK